MLWEGWKGKWGEDAKREKIPYLSKGNLGGHEEKKRLNEGGLCRRGRDRLILMIKGNGRGP